MKVNPIPQDCPAVSPYLHVEETLQRIDFPRCVAFTPLPTLLRRDKSSSRLGHASEMFKHLTVPKRAGACIDRREAARKIHSDLSRSIVEIC